MTIKIKILFGIYLEDLEIFRDKRLKSRTPIKKLVDVSEDWVNKLNNRYFDLFYQEEVNDEEKEILMKIIHAAWEQYLDLYATCRIEKVILSRFFRCNVLTGTYGTDPKAVYLQYQPKEDIKMVRI